MNATAETLFDDRAERAVLGAILVRNEALDEVADTLEPEHFRRAAHASLFRAMRELGAHGKPIDPVTLAATLPTLGVTDISPAFVASLTDGMPRSANATAYAATVREQWLKRSVLAAAEQLMRDARADLASGEALLEQAEAAIYRLGATAVKSDWISGAEWATELYATIETLGQRKGALTGIPTGIRDLDEMTLGLQRGDLVLLGARPALGKTSLALQMALRAAQEAAVAFFSVEMSRGPLGLRAAAGEARVDGYRLRNGWATEVELQRVGQALTDLAELPIYLDESPMLSPLQLRSKLRRLRSRVGALGLVVVDYLQLMAPLPEHRRENKTNQVAGISRALKLMAREFAVPFLVLSQLNRAVERAADKVPTMADLRDSGCLAGDTQIYIPTTGDWHAIESLVGTQPMVASVNAQHKIIGSCASNVFATGCKPVYRLTLTGGSTIRATANHQFLTPDGWRRLDALVVGDSLATPAFLPRKSVQSLSIDQLALMAHLIGNGCVLPSHAVQYTTADEDVAATVAEIASRVFPGQLRTRVKREGRRGEAPSWYQVYLGMADRSSRYCHNPLGAWFRQLGIFGLRSHEKLIPAEVFRQPAVALGEFLSHLWATDGTVSVVTRPTRGHGKHPTRKAPSDLVAISYSTSSPTLASHVRRLLQQVGVRSVIRRTRQRRGRDCFLVCVTGVAGKRRFLDRIGPVGERRTQRHEAARRALESSGNGMAYRGDVYWEAITEIEADGEALVYDITVPGHHCFVANGIVAHNSIEQDADIVLLLHRPEAFEREKKPELDGVAQLIVAKFRNGATGTVDLRWRKEITRFEDVR